LSIAIYKKASLYPTGAQKYPTLKEKEGNPLYVVKSWKGRVPIQYIPKNLQSVKVTMHVLASSCLHSNIPVINLLLAPFKKKIVMIA